MVHQKKTVRRTNPMGARQSPGDKLIEYIRVEEESQMIEQGDGESGGTEPRANIDGSEKDAPRREALKVKGPEGQQPPKDL